MVLVLLFYCVFSWPPFLAKFPAINFFSFRSSNPGSGSAIRKNDGSGSVSGSALNQCGSETLLFRQRERERERELCFEWKRLGHLFRKQKDKRSYYERWDLQTPPLIIYFMGGLLYCLISTELAIDMQVPSCCKIVPPLLPPRTIRTDHGWGRDKPWKSRRPAKDLFFGNTDRKQVWSEVLMCGL
jgi:hypothetical protein